MKQKTPYFPSESDVDKQSTIYANGFSKDDPLIDFMHGALWIKRIPVVEKSIEMYEMLSVIVKEHSRYKKRCIKSGWPYEDPEWYSQSKALLISLK